ncbi:MAG: hypothetical protein GKR90_04325 [Pseudomonadales bacterium]|nr:hypothetical protein [Pseudomonadales bacterium]
MSLTKRLITSLIAFQLFAPFGWSVMGEVPRTQQGKPDLNGIWQAMGPDHFNVEANIGSASSILAAGALGAARGNLGAVIGGQIPYLPEARAQQKRNFADRHALDPAVKCYMPGVPRANYMPFPLQIVQIPDHVFIAYEFAQASRTLYVDQPDFEAPVDTWMGHSLARWEGDTLVVDVSAQVPDTWLDRAGNLHSGALQVEERYDLMSAHHLRYRATLTDPSVYTRPWTLEVILYKNVHPNAQLLDFRCIEHVEELMYGHLSKSANENNIEGNVDE